MAEHKENKTAGDVRRIDKFLRAMNKNNMKSIIGILDEKLDPNSYVEDDESGKSCLLFNAVRHNNSMVVELLLKYGADPNFEDDGGDTPLYAAIDDDCDIKIEELLYEYGANKNHKNKAGNSPLMQLAIRCMDFGYYNFKSETVFNLLEGCLDFNQSNSRDQKLIHLIPLVHCCIISPTDLPKEHVCVRFLKLLLANGISVNVEDGSSLTPLHYATLACCKEAVHFLIEHKAKVLSRSISGQTPLHFLGKSKYNTDFEAILKLLQDLGCESNDTDNMGRTILHYITSSNTLSREAVESVLKVGIKPNIKDNSGLSPIHLCAIPSVFIHPDVLEEDEQGKYSISGAFEVLVQNGADINETDYNGQTPLHYALRYKEKQEVIKCLLELGADVNVRTKTGETALHRGTLYPNLLRTILEFGNACDINAQDNYGSTSLHWAIYYFEEECILLLLEAGANLDIADNEGRSPVEYTTMLKHTSLFNSLGIFLCRETDPLPLQILPMIPATPSPRTACEHIPANAIVYKNEKHLQDDIVGDVTLPVKSTTQKQNQNQKKNDVLTVSVLAAIKESNSSQKPSDFEMNVESLDSSSGSDESVNVFDIGSDEEECVGVDHMWSDCPLLQTVKYENKMVNSISWACHVVHHKQSLANYINLIFHSREMGMEIQTQENKQVARAVFELMGSISAKIKHLNPLFECEIRLAGSWSENTKTVYPDEFDFKWILKQFSSAFEPIETDNECLNGFVKFHLKKEYEDSPFGDFVDDLNFLDSRKVIRTLYSVINDVLFKYTAGDNLYPVKFLKTENGSIDCLSLRWVGCTYKNMLIDVDVVPTIKPSSWVPKKIALSKELLQKLEIPIKCEYSVVLKTPDSRFVKGWNSMFRLSVADLEVAIFQSIPEPILKGYILVKALLKTMYVPQIYVVDYYRQRSLKTYLFKTSFLYELEENCQNLSMCESLNPDYISKFWALKIVNRLSQAIENDHLEPYFVPGNNLLVNNSLTRFNDKVFYQSEIGHLLCLLKVGFEALSQRNGDNEFETMMANESLN